MESKEPIKYLLIIPRKRKKNVEMATYCRKKFEKNQLQSMPWHGMQRTHKNIYKSKKQKSVVMATLGSVAKDVVGNGKRHTKMLSQL